MAKKTTVRLVCVDIPEGLDFEISHAGRLLRMRNNGGWHLPEDSDFELTENGIDYKRDKKGARGTKKAGDDK